MKDEQIKALLADEKVRVAFAEAIAMCAKAVNAFAKSVGPILEQMQLSSLEKEEAEPVPVIEFGSMWECKSSGHRLIASSERDHQEGKISYIFSDGSGRHEMDKETFLRRFKPVKRS